MVRLGLGEQRWELNSRSLLPMAVYLHQPSCVQEGVEGLGILQRGRYSGPQYNADPSGEPWKSK
jgi:hypothetical protein